MWKRNGHDKISEEKLQYDINKEVAKVSTIRKFDKYEYLTGEEILPSNQSQIIQQGKFTYSTLGKAFKELRQLKMKKENKLRHYKY